MSPDETGWKDIFLQTNLDMTQPILLNLRPIEFLETKETPNFGQ